MLRHFVLVMTIAVLVNAPGIAAPSIPSGLWQNNAEHSVMRIEACGGGFCGSWAGAPQSAAQGKPEPACGLQMLRDFHWSDKSTMWEGFMRPPDSTRWMSSSVVSDGQRSLTLRVHWGLFYRTMSFTRYHGKVGEGCQLE